MFLQAQDRGRQVVPNRTLGTDLRAGGRVLAVAALSEQIQAVSSMHKTEEPAEELRQGVRSLFIAKHQTDLNRERGEKCGGWRERGSLIVLRKRRRHNEADFWPDSWEICKCCCSLSIES